MADRSLACATLPLLVWAGACYAPLPPPPPPHLEGFVQADGGTLGTWRIAVVKVSPVDGMDAMDITDPTTPGPVLRVTRLPPPASPTPQAIHTRSMRDTIQLRVANLDRTHGRAEVLLVPDRCRRLDTIVHTRSGAVISARFDCDLGAPGHVSGAIDLVALGLGGQSPLRGQLVASGGALGDPGGVVALNRCEDDGTGVRFWNVLRPDLTIEIDPGVADTRITGSGSSGKLLVTSTAEDRGSFELPASACRTLRVTSDQDGYVRVGDDQTNFYSGRADLDCTLPDGGRLAGSLTFSGC